jgi:hypothetical protein
VGGDFNVDFTSLDPFASLVLRTLNNDGLYCSASIVTDSPYLSYICDSLGNASCLDYFFVSEASILLSCVALEPALNFSDHLPVQAAIQLTSSFALDDGAKNARPGSVPRVARLRWDHADLNNYYNCTRVLLAGLLLNVNLFYQRIRDKAITCDSVTVAQFVDNALHELTCGLNDAAAATVPVVQAHALKFWWDEELDILKSDSISTHRAWVAAGRPRSGATFTDKMRARLLYRARIREKKVMEADAYTSDLHELLLSKDRTQFWKSFRSKFDSRESQILVGGRKTR